MPYRRLGAHCSLLPLVLLVARGWTSEPSCVELVASSLEAMSLKDETDIFTDADATAQPFLRITTRHLRTGVVPTLTPTHQDPSTPSTCFQQVQDVVKSWYFTAILPPPCQRYIQATSDATLFCSRVILFVCARFIFCPGALLFSPYLFTRERLVR